jgi:uncharacterized protein (DUF1697 family)
MAVIVSMLRGVNLSGRNKIKMDTLRAIYQGLGLRDSQTYVQSGNVVFRTKQQASAALAKRIEDAIEHKAGFRPAVILRTPVELRAVIAGNPFAARSGIEPNKLLVTFLAAEVCAQAREEIRAIKADPEEVKIGGHELYIYFPNGVGRSRLSLARLEKAVKVTGTARNWNTVTKLLEMAEAMEAAD